MDGGCVARAALMVVLALVVVVAFTAGSARMGAPHGAVVEAVESAD